MKKQNNEIHEGNNKERDYIELVKTIVANYFKFDITVYATKNGKSSKIQCKQIALYCAEYGMKEHGIDMSRAEIGQLFAYNWSSANVSSAIKRVNELMEYDSDYKRQIDEILIIISRCVKGQLTDSTNVKDYYYINLNDAVSMKLSPGKAILLSGFSMDEINWLKHNFIRTQIQERKHTNTGLYLFQKNENNAKK